MATQNLYSRLRERAANPESPCIRLPGGDVVTYAAADRRSAQLAHALQRLGVQPGDRVLMQTDKSAEAILLYLGCLRAGAALVPLNSAYTLAEVQYFVRDAAPRLIVSTPARQADLQTLCRAPMRLASLDADGRSGSLSVLADAQPDVFSDVPRGGSDLAAIIYTSGTTGRAKGAMLSHANVWSNASVLQQCWEFSATDVLLHVLPIYHIHGLLVAINVTLAAGASLLLLPRFDAELVFAHLAQGSVLMGVPTYFVRLLADARLTPEAVRHVRVFICGSAPLLAQTFRDWQQRTGQAILERYGMSETGIIASNPYRGQRVAGTVGVPLPGVELRITDAGTGLPVPADTPGMIEVRGPNVFSGYWGMPERNDTEFRDGFFITGDIGCVDERGYVHIVGRGKDLIISGGLNVYPKEVEGEIDALAGVVESAVVGLAHGDLGEAVTALVVAPQRPPALDEAEVLRQLRTRLAAFKCPKRVVFVEALPRNAMGKVQKNVLRAAYAQLYSPSSDEQTGDRA